MSGKQTYRLAVVTLLAITTQACTVRHVHKITPAAAEQRLEVGDEIIVSLKTGKRYKAVVVSMDDTQLVTKTGRYVWKDIDHITFKEVDVVGTAFGYILLHVVVAGAAYLFLADTFED